MTTFEMVRKFHEVFGIPYADAPQQLTVERLRLRIQLQIEETCELLAELLPTERGRAWVEGMRVELMEDFELYIADPADAPLDLPAVAKELADIEMVTTGTSVELGIPHDRVCAEVHASNMRKVPGEIVGHGAGKAVKPPGWTPPNIQGVLDDICRCRSYFRVTGQHADACPLGVPAG